MMAAPPAPTATTTTVPAPVPQPPPEPANNTVARLAGADRVATSVVASRSEYGDGKAAAAVLVNSAAYADALPATPLATAKRGPLLLTGAGQLDQRIADELRRVLPRGATVYLAGGESVLTSIEKMGCATLWNRPTLGGLRKGGLLARAWLLAKVAGKPRI